MSKLVRIDTTGIPKLKSDGSNKAEYLKALKRRLFMYGVSADFLDAVVINDDELEITYSRIVPTTVKLENSSSSSSTVDSSVDDGKHDAVVLSKEHRIIAFALLADTLDKTLSDATADVDPGDVELMWDIILRFHRKGNLLATGMVFRETINLQMSPKDTVASFAAVITGKVKECASIALEFAIAETVAMFILLSGVLSSASSSIFQSAVMLILSLKKISFAGAVRRLILAESQHSFDEVNFNRERSAGPANGPPPGCKPGVCYKFFFVWCL